MMKPNPFSFLYGKKIIRMEDFNVGSNGILVIFGDGSSVEFYHKNDCCEDVCIVDIVGDPKDFIGQPLTLLEERSSHSEEEIEILSEKFRSNPVFELQETVVWTFYEFVCPAGSMTVRWLGSSNGYYSEQVDYKIRPALKQ